MDSAPEMTAVRPQGSLAGVGHRSRPAGARPVHAELDWPPPVALVLAADPRAAEAERSGAKPALPRPLRKVAGLGLLERSLLTLRAAGLERFRVVLGADGPRIAKQLRQLPSLAGMSIEVVDCRDADAGDGVALAAGASDVHDGFIAVRAEHVMDTAFVRDFLGRAAVSPDVAQLATDAPSRVFDLDRATKVFAAEGRVHAIGKELGAFDGVDAGLAYFPPGTGRRIGELVSDGARSVADVVTRMAAERPFLAVPTEEGLWQEVDTPAMAREAERRLLRSLAKPTDGFVSRHLNRPLSIATSRHLARWGIRPNTITTFVFIVSLIGAYLVATAEPALIAVGGILFQIASILDGCDGEVSRLKFQGSRWGAWYDTISDNIRYMVFYTALGWAGFRLTGAEVYLWALIPFLAFSTFTVVTMARYVLRTQAHLTNLAVTKKVLGGRKHWWERLINPLSGLIKQDVQALVAMGFCLVNLPGTFFWVTLVGAIVMTVSVVRGLGGEGKSGARARVFVFYSAGLLLLAWLISRMPIGDIEQSFRNAGAGVLLVLLAAPLWYASNAIGVGLLLDGRVRFRHLFYNQVLGETMNTIVPLAGLGGDIFRVRHLSQHVGAASATRAIVQDRLVHALSGPLFAGAAIALTIWMVPLDAAVAAGLSVTAGLLVTGGMVMLGLVLTPYPTRWSAALVRRMLRSSSAAPVEALNRRRLVAVLGMKMVGRLLNLVEIAIIIRLLDLPVTTELVVAIAGLLSASAVVFFFVPQGLGVNEAGIAGAFTMVGLAASYGVAFGLIRRARVVSWAALGLLIQLAVWGWKRLRASRPETANAAVAEGS
jgi:CDP-L-myo-inositol myo-inositolphosphotransferase